MKRKSKKQYGISNSNGEQTHLLSEPDDTSDSNVELTPSKRPSLKRASSRAGSDKSPFKSGTESGRTSRQSSKESKNFGKSTPQTKQQQQEQKISEKQNKKKAYLRRMDSKVNMFAPEADDTDFADVPALTVCPHCRGKVVTRTSYSKYKPGW